MFSGSLLDGVFMQKDSSRMSNSERADFVNNPKICPPGLWMAPKGGISFADNIHNEFNSQK